jgi:hypothetical protein
MLFRRAAIAVAILGLLDPAARATEKSNLRVLYAGHVDSPRAGDFTSFLAKHFAKVTVVDFGKFQEGDAKEHDVVIFDWTSIYPRDKEGKISRDKEGPGVSMPPAPRLSQSFDRATILVGAAGGQVAGTLQLKIGWL